MEIRRPIHSISEAARKLSLSAEWLREGKKRVALPLAVRDRNGYRYHIQADIEPLQNRRLRERGE